MSDVDRAGACAKALLDGARLRCDDTRLIGFFGVLIARKRPLLFVEAIAALRRLAPDLPVLRSGVRHTARDRCAIRCSVHAERHGVADAIRLMGFRYPGAEWIAACDLLMVPAVDEPFGRTLIEAMLVGTPIVATRSGGNVEALLDGALGLLVDVRRRGCAGRGRARRCCEDGERYAELAGNGARPCARPLRRGAATPRAVMELYDELVRRAPPEPSRPAAQLAAQP